MRNKYLLFVYLLLLNLIVSAQNTELKIMQYNLLYYGGVHYDCNSTTNNVDSKNTALQTIIDYVLPDVFCVNELDDDSYYTTYLLNNALNTNGRDYYAASNPVGSDIINMIYYDTRKLDHVSHTTWYVYPRLIDFFKMKVKNTDVYITFVVAHLLSGQDPADYDTRADATISVMTRLETSSTYPVGNYLFMGDLNLYESTEQAYQNLINYSNIDYRFYDPINQAGAWHNNYAYANYHTQSTHYTSNGCPITGGLDDRFDFILISNDIKYNNKNVSYINGSYETLGQDGNHFNDAVNYGSNSSAPTNVIQALYDMSDHLPVTLSLNVNTSSSVSDVSNAKLFVNNPVENELNVQLNAKTDNDIWNIEIISISGEVVYRNKTQICDQKTINVENLKTGMYILRLKNEEYTVIEKIIKL